MVRKRTLSLLFPTYTLVPNAETIAAMKAARKGELVTVGKLDNLLKKLHEDD